MNETLAANLKIAVVWIPFAPTDFPAAATKRLLDLALEVKGICPTHNVGDRNQLLERIRKRLEHDRLRRTGKDSQRFVVAANILLDLAKQGWIVNVDAAEIKVARPINPLDPEADRQHIRQQLHAERDEQLRQESVRVFIKSMEVNRFHNGKSVSVHSLMRDGRDLGEKLRAGEHAIQPYIQFVRGEEKCEWTGLRLVDIWRYFRHTWATPYKSIPGRSMMMVVRDRAAAFHPVIGIAALSSATVGLTVRDEAIGWTFRQVAGRIIADPSPRYARWMLKITDEAIEELYKGDLLADGVFALNDIKKPTAELVQELITLARQHRKEHYRFMQGQDYKGTEKASDISDDDWESLAKTLLFRSKREQELANLFQIRLSLNTHFGSKITNAKVKDFMATGEGRVALTKLIRKAKADRVGTVIADLTICGAVPPYGEVLAGKLVAMLMTSPEVADEYHRRYRRSPSIIASSMAGVPIQRPAHLVYISTTSLYGRRPNQYDRIAVPVDRIHPGASGLLKYEYLGRTKGIGTFQFSNQTVDAMKTLIEQTSQGQRVNSVFGEGVNPRLRKIRDGLDELGLPANALLDHGAPRLVYGVPLIENLADYLLGIDSAPKYVLKASTPAGATLRISDWWFERWCRPRTERPEILEGLAAHTLVYPIRHGARVKLPTSPNDDPTLFDDDE
jgi:hypothetical protein